MEKRQELLPAGDYTAIIAGVRVEDLDSGSKVLILQFVVARGPHRGEGCQKLLYLGFDAEQEAKVRFARMGAALRSLATVREDAQGLVGILLAIRLCYDDVARQKVLIFRSHGRDDVQKYR